MLVELEKEGLGLDNEHKQDTVQRLLHKARQVMSKIPVDPVFMDESYFIVRKGHRFFTYSSMNHLGRF